MPITKSLIFFQSGNKRASSKNEKIKTPCPKIVLKEGK